MRSVDTRDELLQLSVDVAREVFLAEATSIALLDAGARELVFAAVAGRGAQELVGARFLSSEGIAGRVAESGQPLVVDDLGRDPGFARDVATETGYMPDAIMAAPLLEDGRVLGVLSVLDRGATQRGPQQELELLVLLCAYAAAALGLAERARAAARLLR